MHHVSLLSSLAGGRRTGVLAEVVVGLVAEKIVGFLTEGTMPGAWAEGMVSWALAGGTVGSSPKKKNAHWLKEQQ